ncbi:MAG: ParB/RepB/Spo0J family partition protein [Spirochaetaceae bacterium]|jgi:ParB family chromosome partitioning protein|nr:ParB/RepB/Spo0J family partition protein [Spirochaetaceae bacterium]
MAVKRFGLGKGIDALLPLDTIGNPPSETASGTAMLSLDDIIANPNQPRKTFDDAELAELAETIKAHGVLQPIVVENAEDGNYIIVMGERRTRAARLAGLTEIPAIIRRFTPEESFVVALIENIQRTDLNPIEEALAYKNLMEISGLNQDAAAVKVGKNRATFANALRLLKLPDAMQSALRGGSISAGHARALLSVEDEAEREALFQEIVSGTLSVREAERLASATKPTVQTRLADEGGGGGGKKSEKAPPQKRDPELEDIEQKFIEALGTKVKLDGDFSKGSIKIEYYSMEDLDRLYELIAGGEARDTGGS